MEQYACTICTYIVAILAFLILTEMKRHLNLYYDSQNSLKLQVYFFFFPLLIEIMAWKILCITGKCFICLQFGGGIWTAVLAYLWQDCDGVMVKVFLIFRFTLPRETAGLLKKYICTGGRHGVKVFRKGDSNVNFKNIVPEYDVRLWGLWLCGDIDQIYRRAEKQQRNMMNAW